MIKRPLVLATLAMTAAAVAGISGIATTAAAHGTGHGTAPTGHGTPASAPPGAATPVGAGTPVGGATPVGAGTPAGGGSGEFFVADLNGRNEVPVAGGPAVGDPDGKARATIRIQGDQLCFTVEYKRIAPLTAGHIHAGAAGVNGGIKVGFVASSLPGSLRAFTGCVSGDAAALDAIKANPGDHYVNLHSGEFPGGAVRGQLRKLDGAADLLAPLRGRLVGLMDGGQETPALGDADGRATGFVRAGQGQVDYAFTWSGIGAPTKGH
ncbi:MAG TPA: CHRD domain-containing protein, partial [Pilimelia sp.]|nr:CHRD domain-containing protein [Pilimelia sp.]